MATPEQVRQVAKEVLEAANDLRYLEVCAAFMTERDVRAAVAGEGDTGAARYQEWDPNSTAGAAIKAAEAEGGGPMGTQFDWIIDQFEYYARIADEPYASMSGVFDDVMNILDTTKSNHQDNIQSRSNLGQWDGKFARNLRDNVFDTLDDVASNQTVIAKNLQAIVLTHRNIVQAARDSIWDIGNQTKARLNSTMNPAPNNSTRDALLTVVGAVMAVVGTAATPVTGGASLVLVLGVLATVKTVAESAIKLNDIAVESGKSAPTPIAGGTTAEILLSMLEAIRILDQQISVEEEELNTRVQTSIGCVDAFLSDKGDSDKGWKPKSWFLQSLRPEVADGVPPRSKFDHVDR